jgi:hypothetical protein
MGAGGLTEQGWDLQLSAGDWSLNLFTFEHGYEMVPGRWTFHFLQGDRVMAEQAFDVVPQAQAADVLADCPGPPLMM